MKRTLTALVLMVIFVSVPAFAQTSNPSINERTPTANEKYEDKILRRLKVAIEVSNPVTRKYALKLATIFPDSEESDGIKLSQIFNIYDYLKKNWKYVNDPRSREYLARASETIEVELKGDCDDFAVLMASLVENIGYETRITSAVSTKDAHMFTEVYVGKSSRRRMQEVSSALAVHYIKRANEENRLDEEINRMKQELKAVEFRMDQNGGLWLNLDWWSSYAGGNYYEHNTGTIYYPLNSRYERYRIDRDGMYEYY